MEQFVQQTLLYDFYGELLTEHQRRIYEDVVLNDYSLSEVAADLGISRQGVHDNVKRCNKILSDYEEKLHLVEKFVNIKEKITGFTVLQKIAKHQQGRTGFEVEHISQEILESCSRWHLKA